MASKRVRELEAKVEALTQRLTYLENMHANFEHADNSFWTFSPLAKLEYTYHDMAGRYGCRDLTAREVQEAMNNPHPYTREHTAQTRKITGITLQELAQFVIDKKPIKREYYKSDRYETAYRADGITKSVQTGLGDISIKEGSW
jgi:hypothetical protein